MGSFTKLLTATVVLALGMIMLLFALEMVFLNHKSKHIQVTNKQGYGGTTFLTAKHPKETEIGAIEAANVRLVVLGLCYNLGDRLHNTRTVVNRYRAPFKDSQVVLFENDSTDGTRERLKAWSEADPSVHILDCCDEGSCECKLKNATQYQGGMLSQSRIQRMADYRTRCLQYAKEHFEDYEYVLVMDMDLGGAVTPNAMELALATRKDTHWDSVSCAGKMPMFGSFGTASHLYDSLSFISTPKQLWSYDKSSESKVVLVSRWFRLNAKAFVSKRLIRVGSYFGGATLYDSKLFFQGKYKGAVNEHIWLQKSMQATAGRDGRFFILKSWVCNVGFQGPAFWEEHK